jgi:Spy/CpxP family protein refolding chaperone
MDSLSPDEKLTEEQKQDLIEIMYQKQEDVFSEIGYDPREQIEFPSDIDEEKIAEITKNMEKIHSQSVESAKGTMSESQLEQFNNYLKNQREIYEMSLKMTSQQFGE